MRAVKTLATMREHVRIYPTDIHVLVHYHTLEAIVLPILTCLAHLNLVKMEERVIQLTQIIHVHVLMDSVD